MNLKQLFCKHVWKSYKEEWLKSFKNYKYNFGDYYVTKLYASYEKCLKCDKMRIVEVEKLEEE